MSPDSRCGPICSMVRSTTPAGIISQIARGLASLLTISCSEADPLIPFSFAISPTTVGDTSNTTHSCPPATSRRTIFAPIRPNPTIPSCILPPPKKLIRSTSEIGSDLARNRPRPHLFVLSIPPNQIGRRSIMRERRFRSALQFTNNALREHLAQLNAPLIERVDTPDRTLREHHMLVQRNQ